MINVFFYSIANKKSNKLINTILNELLDAEYISEKDKIIVKHTLEVAEKGAYPSVDYYEGYPQPEFVYSALSEILVYADDMKDFYQQQFFQSKVLKCINGANKYSQLLESLSSLCVNASTSVTDTTLDKFKPYTYKDAEAKPYEEGLKSGIEEVDSLTYGFQRGTVGSMCAYTGEGKSTFWNSCLFKNALAGKKCVLMSLEMPVELVSLMIEARYLYEVKGIEVTAQDLEMHKLSEETKKLVDAADEDYRSQILSNLLIADESVLNKQIVTDSNRMSNLFSLFEKSLGGLDMIVWDHVGQLELMFPDMGNQIIRTITTATKSWYNREGTHIFTGFAVQCNREGRKRADKRKGVYDLQAISDLNEIEKSSTYCIFMFTPDDYKLLQETKVCVLKHRLGAVLTEPVTVTFNPSVGIVGSQIEKVEASDDFDATGGLGLEQGNDSFDSDFD